MQMIRALFSRLNQHRYGGLLIVMLGLWFVFSSKVLWADEETEPPVAETGNQAGTAVRLAKLRDSLSPLDFERPTSPSPEVQAYFDYYELHARSHRHYFGTFNSGNYVLAAHFYRPESARGTVVLMHGFLDHVGTLRSTIQHLLKQGYAVAAYDQPGHGLSNGERAAISDFADYASIFDDFLRIVDRHMPPPYQSVAHSTGAAIVADHLLTHEDGELEQVILVAPLVRSAFWHLSIFLTPLADIFTDAVPRVFRDNSSDKLFLESVQQDPLQPRRTSLTWFNALLDWNERIQSYPPNPRPLVIIQGNEDSIVDWDYNLQFLVTKFPNAHVYIIDEAEHQLLNEGPVLRAKALGIIDETLTVPLKTTPQAAMQK